ncbi:MAG: molybdopterin molybdotransferase MoeA [Candidatus Riflebacteria bacterium]|nr:molybdopterin molybdotransferase MoeA [Candidatus Riflebacteria bacterium]
MLNKSRERGPALLTFDEALERVISEASHHKLSSEGVSLDAACGRVLAAALAAPGDQPACDNSAMDGYCIRHSDAASARPEAPITLPVAGEAMAGRPLAALPDMNAAYIATGGMLPENADTVVKIEDVSVSADGKSVTFSSIPPVGTYIRRQGKDVRAGDIVLPAGESLSPFAIGTVASLGRMVIPVTRQPRIALMTSGDEIVMPFDEPKPWQVRNANSYALASLIRESGGVPVDFGIVRDCPKRAMAVLRDAFSTCDLIVTCGGVSMGKKDPFIAAFRELGVDIRVHGVAIRPGKPFFFGLFEGKPLFGLPGNQASCVVTFEIFARPFIRRVLGDRCPDRLLMRLSPTLPLVNHTGRDHFMRARLTVDPANDGRPCADVFQQQDSHLLTSLIGANLLVRHPGSLESAGTDTLLECRLTS